MREAGAPVGLTRGVMLAGREGDRCSGSRPAVAQGNDRRPKVVSVQRYGKTDSEADESRNEGDLQSPESFTGSPNSSIASSVSRSAILCGLTGAGLAPGSVN